MKRGEKLISEEERLALLALWAVPGIGPKMLEGIRQALAGDLTVVLSQPLQEWAAQVKLSNPVRQLLATVPSMSDLGCRLRERAERAGIGIAYPGDAAYPSNLVGLADAPPLLFYHGVPSAPRRRVAMVGSRHPDHGFLAFAERFAAEVAEAGVGIVSGAAEGVDRACHRGALAAGQETWAFLGSALDELDPPQAQLLPKFLAGGGIFYSELPLGARASSTTFPRRNRLISGAADAVLVLRAGVKSGSLHTADFARKQGRPVLALPGDAYNEAAYGCNDLIRSGKARLCIEPKDVFAALDIQPSVGVKPRLAGIPLSLRELSDQARFAYKLLIRRRHKFDELLGACQMPSAALTSALCELELMGLIIQHPGKLYERI
jgi:DNA processing protein